MAKFTSLHKDIKTEIQHLLIDGERTFARLERAATHKITNLRTTAQIMVLKEFKNDKVAKLWLMTDDEIIKAIWSEQASFTCD